MNNPVLLTDGIITLRPFTESDAQAHLHGEDSEQIAWLSGGKSSLEGVKQWIKKNQAYWENNGPVFNFAIVNEANTLIGMIEANSNYEHLAGLSKGDANISYGLYPAHRGEGYASRAVHLLVTFLQEKDLKRAVIRVNPENTNSLKVPLRCGFVEKETITTEEEQLVIFVKNLE